MKELTVGKYDLCMDRLHMRIYDACVILKDLKYCRQGFGPEELDFLSHPVLHSLFWKNRYVIHLQLSKVFQESEEGSLPKLLDAIDAYAKRGKGELFVRPTNEVK